MTKEMFRKLAQAGLESLMTLPDDLFENTFPTIRLAHRYPDGRVDTVFVGVEPEDDDELDEETASGSIQIKTV